MYRVLALGMLLMIPSAVLAQGASCPPLVPVSMTIHSEIQSTTAGSPVVYDVQLQNESDTLVHDARLAVEVVPTFPGGSIVRFIDPTSIAILPNSMGKAQFTVNVPDEVITGNYTVYATLLPANAKRSEAFTRYMQPTASTPLSINGSDIGLQVGFLRVNRAPVQPNASVLFKGGSEVLGAHIENNARVPYIGSFTWKVYSPDAGIDDAPLYTATIPVEAHPRSVTGADYKMPDASGVGYYIEGDLMNGSSTIVADMWLQQRYSAFPDLRCHFVATAGPIAQARSWALEAGAGAIIVIAGLMALRLRTRITHPLA